MGSAIAAPPLFRVLVNLRCNIIAIVALAELIMAHARQSCFTSTAMSPCLETIYGLFGATDLNARAAALAERLF